MVAGAILTLLFLQVISCQGDCPDFWTPFQGSCYHLFSELEPWAQAQFMCSFNDANLVTIETAAENNFLKKMVINSKVNTSVWLGADDVVHEGDFRWIAGNLPLHFTDWAPGDPNNGGNNENCIEFWYHGSWQWADYVCHKNNRFICEKRDPVVVG